MLGLISAIFILISPYSCLETQVKRHTSNYQHPAFAMFMHAPMSFPGHVTSGSGYQECIMGDIVCPSWCLMEDDWGCKTCPCGPANGMSPPLMTEEHREQHHEERHDCLGTMLCMLTCKDGFRLGPRGDNGCQACTCTKKNHTVPVPTVTSAPSITQSHGMTRGPSYNGSGCKWPLCMNGQSPHGGPSIGGLSASGPNGTGGFVSPTDCFGPSCSAKNGMRLVNAFGDQHGDAPMPSPTPPSMRVPTPAAAISTSGQGRHCPATHACVSACRDTVKLTPPSEPGGCPGCRCIKAPPPPVTTVHVHCPMVERCKTECRQGFEITPVKDATGCPQCACVALVSPPAPTVSPRKPDVLTECADTLHCMETCTKGYTLADDDSKGCPICTCDRVSPGPLISMTGNTKRPEVNIGTSRQQLELTGSSGNSGHVIIVPAQHMPDASGSEVVNTQGGPLDQRTAADACPEAARCIVGCSGNYRLTPVPGSPCPRCQCDDKAAIATCTDPACAASNSTDTTHTLLSPGQCVAILHCVMTCRTGYDVGDYDTNGCPTCTCLDI